MTQLNEIKRMQQLAGILTESQLNEGIIDLSQDAVDLLMDKTKFATKPGSSTGVFTIYDLSRPKGAASFGDDMASQKVGFLYTPESKYKAYKLESDDENTVKKITALKESQLNEKMDEGKINSEFEKEILKVLKAKFDLDPTTATIDFGPNGMSIKPVNYQVWADKFTKGNQGRNGNYVDDKAQKIAAYFNKKYGKNVVAESLDQLDEVINNALKAAGIK